MNFSYLRLFRPVRVICIVIVALTPLACSLQTQERIPETAALSLKERIAATLSSPVTRFPLIPMNGIDYAAELYANPHTRKSILRFYAELSGSETVARAILDAATEKDIDVNLAFALAKAESDFHPRAVGRNLDRSLDRGLFQLNSNTFPRLTEKEAFDPFTNARKGMAHLRFSLDYGGDVIRALAVYNAGLVRTERGAVPASTYAYIERVLTYDEEIASRFREEILPRWIPLSGPPA